MIVIIMKIVPMKNDKVYEDDDVDHHHDHHVHIGRLARMSVSGYRGRRFEPLQQYVVSLSKTLYPHCSSRLSCEMSTWWGQPREG